MPHPLHTGNDSMRNDNCACIFWTLIHFICSHQINAYHILTTHKIKINLSGLHFFAPLQPRWILWQIVYIYLPDYWTILISQSPVCCQSPQPRNYGFSNQPLHFTEVLIKLQPLHFITITQFSIVQLSISVMDFRHFLGQLLLQQGS